MNTLGKSITCKFFKSPEDYLRMRKAWSQLMRSRTKLDVSIHVYYLILCGKNWTKAFTMPKRFANPAELAIVRALYRLPCAPMTNAKQHSGPYQFFAEFLSEEADDLIVDLVGLGRMRIYKAIEAGQLIEPYLAPVEVALHD